MMADARALIDPALLPLLDSFPPFDWTNETLPAVRARLDAAAEQSAAGEQVLASTHWIARDDRAPDVPIRLLRPAASAGPLPVYLHVHGGGYVAGSARGSDARNGEIVRNVGCAVVSVDYRLAPEHCYPAALDDCHLALAWVIEQARVLGLDAERVAIGGESAGGGLAAALALKVRDEGLPRPVLQVLTFPMLDDRREARAGLPHTGEFVWTRASNDFGWDAYLGSEGAGAMRDPHYAAAARAIDLGGVAPAFIVTGTLDLFARDNLDYARRLLAAAVPLELHVYPGAFHGFNLSPDAEVATRYRREVEGALKRAFGSGQT